jgi:NAD(P)-dependent dehydrogenase (short-subunit alcohol dehydrogenase family)
MANALITGASTGIGEACALHLDRLGHRVFAGVRRTVDGERLAAQTSGRLVPVMLDVTDPEQIAAAAVTIDEAVGGEGLHGLVNNAGTAMGGPVEFLPLDDWRQQLEVNVLGQVAVTQAMLGLLRRATGRVVFIGSISGRLSTPLMAPYGASKFAIEAIGSSLSEELRPWGMRVVIVEPGTIATPIWDKGRATADQLEAAMPDEARALYGGEIDRMRSMIDAQERSGIPPAAVAEVVFQALSSRRPKRRYVVGVEAKAAAVMARLLPDAALAPILRRLGP